MLFIPDLSEVKKDEDKLRKVLMDLEVMNYEDGLKVVNEYIDEIGKL